jgi:hypothetical protein
MAAATLGPSTGGGISRLPRLQILCDLRCLPRPIAEVATGTFDRSLIALSEPTT